MVGADKSTQLWRHPLERKVCIELMLQIVEEFCTNWRAVNGKIETVDTLTSLMTRSFTVLSTAVNG